MWNERFTRGSGSGQGRSSYRGRSGSRGQSDFRGPPNRGKFSSRRPSSSGRSFMQDRSPRDQSSRTGRERSYERDRSPRDRPYFKDRSDSYNRGRQSRGRYVDRGRPMRGRSDRGRPMRGRSDRGRPFTSSYTYNREESNEQYGSRPYRTSMRGGSGLRRPSRYGSRFRGSRNSPPDQQHYRPRDNYGSGRSSGPKESWGDRPNSYKLDPEVFKEMKTHQLASDEFVCCMCRMGSLGSAEAYKEHLRGEEHRAVVAAYDQFKARSIEFAAMVTMVSKDQRQIARDRDNPRSYRRRRLDIVLPNYKGTSLNSAPVMRCCGLYFYTKQKFEHHKLSLRHLKVTSIKKQLNHLNAEEGEQRANDLEDENCKQILLEKIAENQELEKEGENINPEDDVPVFTKGQPCGLESVGAAYQLVCTLCDSEVRKNITDPHFLKKHFKIPVHYDSLLSEIFSIKSKAEKMTEEEYEELVNGIVAEAIEVDEGEVQHGVGTRTVEKPKREEATAGAQVEEVEKMEEELKARAAEGEVVEVHEEELSEVCPKEGEEYHSEGADDLDGEKEIVEEGGQELQGEESAEEGSQHEGMEEGGESVEFIDRGEAKELEHKEEMEDDSGRGNLNEEEQDRDLPLASPANVQSVELDEELDFEE